MAQPAPATNPQTIGDTFEKDLDALFVNGGLTSDQAATRARTSSPVVDRRVEEVSAATAQVDVTSYQRLPYLVGRFNYTRQSFLAPIVFGPTMIPFLQNNYLLEGNLNIPLSDYVVRFPKLMDSVRLGRDAARVNLHASQVNASEDARLAYYEWVRAKLQVLVAQRQLVQVQATLKQVRALADVQRLSRADLLRVESQEASAEQVLDQLRNLEALREEQLRLQIGAPQDEPLAIGEDIRKDIPAPAAESLDDLMKVASTQRLELRAIDFGIAAKEKQRESDLADKLPKVTGFAIADYANPNPRIFPQEDRFKFTWSAGAFVTWTLTDAVVSFATDRKLRAEANELRADRENVLRGTRIEVLNAQQAVQLAQRALLTSQKGLAAAEEGYRVRRELLNAERATAVELVDAETDLTRARITALNARVDLRVALSQLTHALGQDTK